jgi:hypothetical protein
MTQDGSSVSSDIAAGDYAPPEFRALAEPQKTQLQDTDALVSDQICEQISDRLKGAMHITNDDYSATTKDLLRRAWSMAAQLQHYRVEPQHIIVGMVTGRYSSGAPSEFVGLDSATLRTLRIRTMTALARLETAAEMSLVPNLWATADLVSWISEALRIAQSRGEPLEPDDLFQVMLDAQQSGHLLHDALQDSFGSLGSAELPVIGGSSGPPSVANALYGGIFVKGVAQGWLFLLEPGQAALVRASRCRSCTFSPRLHFSSSTRAGGFPSPRPRNADAGAHRSGQGWQPSATPPQGACP